MRILLVSQWCYPEPDLKVLPLAEQMSGLGHQVEILTGFPNYPGGVVYDGYKIKFYQKEVVGNITIHRVPLYPSHSKNKFERIANYLSFLMCSAIWGLFVTKKADVIYAYHPPITTVYSAIFLKIFKRAKLVIDIQDMWPDTLKTTGMISNDKIINIIGKGCLLAYKFVDKIVVLSHGFKKVLVGRGVSAEKIEVIHNWSLDINDQVDAKEVLRQKVGFSKFTILFAGNMGPAQSLETIIDAARDLQDENIEFAFVGSGLSKEQLEKSAKGLNNVKFYGRVSKEEVGKYLDASDALIVHLKRDELFEVTIPSKIQAYLKCGKPILVGVLGDAKNMIEGNGAGISFLPEDSESLKSAVKKMLSLSESELENMGEKGKRFYDENLSLEVGSKKFDSVFSSFQ